MFTLEILPKEITHWFRVEFLTKYFGFLLVVTKERWVDSLFPQINVDNSLEEVLNLNITWGLLWFEIFFGEEPDENYLDRVDELNNLYYLD